MKWDEAGLVTIVAQDRLSGTVRMVAHANEEALLATQRTGEAHFYSRSRQTLWRKGETSGHTMAVSEIWVDCDADAVIYMVDPVGPSCHTGQVTCFFRRLGGEAGLATPVVERLGEVISARAAGTAEKSYTKSLLEAGAARIGEKVREEAAELAVALERESDERVISESADVLYHAMVGLQARGLTLRDVEKELARRFGVSGHDEKASR